MSLKIVWWGMAFPFPAQDGPVLSVFCRADVRNAGCWLSRVQFALWLSVMRSLSIRCTMEVSALSCGVICTVFWLGLARTNGRSLDWSSVDLKFRLTSEHRSTEPVWSYFSLMELYFLSGKWSPRCVIFKRTWPFQRSQSSTFIYTYSHSLSGSEIPSRSLY